MDFVKLETNPAFKKLASQGNRGIVYEIVGFDLVVKWIQGEKAAKDSDIQALLDLNGVDFFPTLYAYEESAFLVMEKVSGKDIVQLIQQGLITDGELIMVKDQYRDAVSIGIQKKRYDWDFKLEHLFWDQKAKKLKIIDLGLWDVFNSSSDSKRYIADSLSNFEREIQWLK